MISKYHLIFSAKKSWLYETNHIDATLICNIYLGQKIFIILKRIILVLLILIKLLLANYITTSRRLSSLTKAGCSRPNELPVMSNEETILPLVMSYRHQLSHRQILSSTQLDFVLRWEIRWNFQTMQFECNSARCRMFMFMFCNLWIHGVSSCTEDLCANFAWHRFISNTWYGHFIN